MLKRAAINFSVLLVIFILGFVWWQRTLLPVNSLDKQSVIFTVKKANRYLRFAAVWKRPDW